MKNTNKILSIVLTCIMLSGLLPLITLAEAGEQGDEKGQIGNYYTVNDETGAITDTLYSPTLTGSTQQSYEDGLVKVNKTIAVTDKENEFDISLEVITGQKIVEQYYSDAAVVLVIDSSNSMNEDMAGNDKNVAEADKRITKAKEAAQAFINAFASSAPNVQRKVAIVKFNGLKPTTNNQGEVTKEGFDGAKTILGWSDASDKSTTGDTLCTEISGLAAEGGTNIEAGLILANNLLKMDTVKDIANKNVLLLSDGSPTYGIDHTKNPDTTSTEVICPGGINMIGSGEPYNWFNQNYDPKYLSSIHPIHTQVGNVASTTIPSGISRYGVYVGQSDKIYCGERNCSLYVDSPPTKLPDWTTSEEQKKPYFSFDGAGYPTLTWLSEDLNFTTYQAQDAAQLIADFTTIAGSITQANPWILTDPMAEYIDFVKFNRDLNPLNEAVYDNRTITWDLKKSPKPTPDSEGNYTYTLPYHIKLNNLKDGFVHDRFYPTNEPTSLTYQITRTNQPNINGTAYFNIPSVKGLVGSLELTKAGEGSTPLVGAIFELTTDDGPNFKMEVTSGNDGKFKFEKIPSGHKYTLTETSAPGDYVPGPPLAVAVSYGKTTIANVDPNDPIVNKHNHPGMDKIILVQDEEAGHAGIKPGETVTFKLKSNVPDYLGAYLNIPKAEEPEMKAAAAKGAIDVKGVPPERGKYELTFHDKLDSHLTYADNLTVTVNGKTLPAPTGAETDLYTVTMAPDTGDGCTFHVTMDLVKIYEATDSEGNPYFTLEDIASAPAIIVTYDATVNDDTTHGAYPNEAWVTYEGTPSQHDIVYVHIYAIDVFKYDQSNRSFIVCLGDTFRSGGTFVSIVVNGEKVITTKDRFAFEGDGSTAQMIASFIANNPDKEGHNEHQWGYKAEAVEGKPNCVKVTALTSDKILPATTASCYLVGLGGHEYTQNPENHPLPIEFVYPPLAGAEFALYDNEGCTGEPVATGTSGADGMIVFEGLEPGTYYLKETKAPDGYIKSDAVLEVKIEATESTENTAHIVHTKFANSNIPHTGGMGTKMFTVIGLLLLMGAGLILFFSRRRDTE